jgi:hypothetical protein
LINDEKVVQNLYCNDFFCCTDGGKTKFFDKIISCNPPFSGGVALVKKIIIVVWKKIFNFALQYLCYCELT